MFEPGDGLAMIRPSMETFMAASSEVQSRIDRLHAELSDLISKHARQGRHSRFLANLLMVSALLSSAGAGIAGFFVDSVPRRVVGALALLPAVLTLVASHTKVDGKGHWNYRYQAAADSLLLRLQYDLPESPTADNVAAIAKDKAKLGIDMQKQWERDFKQGWNLSGPGHP